MRALSNDGTSMLWRRLDSPGHDVARLAESVAGNLLEGTAVFAEEGQACRLDYTIACDAAWRTVSTRVSGWIEDRAVRVDIEVSNNRRWIVNGLEHPELQECEDVDLSFTPATNMLPIRRLTLGIGERAAVRAAWFVFPSCEMQVLEQAYERTGETSYRYESNGGAFVATLRVNAGGFVTSYPGLWRAER